MDSHINEIRQHAQSALEAVQERAQLEDVRVAFLGRKGKVADLFKMMGRLSPEERPRMGNALNSLKQEIADWVAQKESTLGTGAAKSSQGAFDTSLPGKHLPSGALHPLSQVLDEIQEIFVSLGFEIAEGPEVETEHNNFEALNIPPDHPSRESFDTFYVTDDLLLRSHTSPVQIRVMENRTPPLRILSPGKTYRPDALDASHSFMFHQVEGFAVDKHITFADLKGVMGVFVREMFGAATKTRFRPHFFPFTEPSVEVDISCFLCKQKGCRVCSHNGWLEILGAGLIHPAVLKAVGYDPATCQGFAFGMGVERIAMLKGGIDDIRLFTENDVRFIRQF